MRRPDQKLSHDVLVDGSRSRAPCYKSVLKYSCARLVDEVSCVRRVTTDYGVAVKEHHLIHAYALLILIVDDQHLDTKLRVDGVEVQIQNPTRVFLSIVA